VITRYVPTCTPRFILVDCCFDFFFTGLPDFLPCLCFNICSVACPDSRPLLGAGQACKLEYVDVYLAGGDSDRFSTCTDATQLAKFKLCPLWLQVPWTRFLYLETANGNHRLLATMKLSYAGCAHWGHGTFNYQTGVNIMVGWMHFDGSLVRSLPHTDVQFCAYTHTQSLACAHTFTIYCLLSPTYTQMQVGPDDAALLPENIPKLFRRNDSAGITHDLVELWKTIAEEDHEKIRSQVLHERKAWSTAFFCFVFG
jgi:hypothetical protein